MLIEFKSGEEATKTNEDLVPLAIAQPSYEVCTNTCQLLAKCAADIRWLSLRPAIHYPACMTGTP